MARPREFDPEVALRKALLLFWEKGYEGTSVNDLAETIGVTKPSLYACFGNKEQLFRTALDRYESAYLGFFDCALAQDEPREIIRRLLCGFADTATMNNHPRGCLGTNAAVACSEASDEVRDELVRRRAGGETKLCQRLTNLKRDGRLPADVDPAVLAKYVMTLVQGLALQAKAGVNREALHKVIELTMATLPLPADPAAEDAGSDAAAGD